MAALLATCTKEEQRSEGVKPTEINLSAPEFGI
jgi:hypothetical protein